MGGSVNQSNVNGEYLWKIINGKIIIIKIIIKIIKLLLIIMENN